MPKSLPLLLCCLVSVALLPSCSPTEEAAKPAADASGAAAAPAAAAAESAPKISFAADVKPIFDSHCASCHLDGEQKGSYNLDSRESALSEGKNGARIVAGNSAGSNMILRVSGAEGVKKMPPKGEALSPAQIAVLSAWIDQGANWE